MREGTVQSRAEHAAVLLAATAALRAEMQSDTLTEKAYHALESALHGLYLAYGIVSALPQE